MSPPAELLASLANVFASFGARWYVFGAQAVVVWGRPRLTADIDVTAFIASDDVARFVRSMTDARFDLRFDATPEFLAATRVLPFVHRSTGWPLDVVLAGPGLEERFMDRAVVVEFAGVPAPVIRAEDLVVTKVLSGRPRDVEDVYGVLLEQGSKLDYESMRSTLRQLEQALGVSDLIPALERAVERARRPSRDR